MNKDIKNIERPKMLRQILLEMTPGETLTIYYAAFKVQQCRVTAYRLNKFFNKKTYLVSDKGMTDRCIVTRVR